MCLEKTNLFEAFIKMNHINSTQKHFLRGIKYKPRQQKTYFIHMTRTMISRFIHAVCVCALVARCVNGRDAWDPVCFTKTKILFLTSWHYQGPKDSFLATWRKCNLQITLQKVVPFCYNVML